MWFLWIVGAAALWASFLALSWFGRWGERWGATTEEFTRSGLGDRWLEGGPRARVRMTRAVWIEAPAEQVWPWVAQMGRGAGWYSYDRLDNGGRRSARHLVSWIPDPQPGDASPIGYLRWIDPGRELAWWVEGVRFLGARFRVVMHYWLVADGKRTRLLMRVQSDTEGALGQAAGWVFRIIDTIMARRQLLGIQERAERFGDRQADPDTPETSERDQFQLYQVIYACGSEAGAAGRRDAANWRQAAVLDGVVESQSKGSGTRDIR